MSCTWVNDGAIFGGEGRPGVSIIFALGVEDLDFHFGHTNFEMPFALLSRYFPLCLSGTQSSWSCCSSGPYFMLDDINISMNNIPLWMGTYVSSLLLRLQIMLQEYFYSGLCVHMQGSLYL